MQRKPLRPGVYSKVYRCVVCGCELTAKKMLTTKAKQLGESECVCEPCIPQWQERQSRSLQNLTREGLLESLAVTLASVWVRWRKVVPKKKKEAHAKEVLSTFLDASLGDRGMRAQLLAIVKLDELHRQEMLDPIIAKLHARNAPEELLLFMTSLKDNDIAKCAKEILDPA